MDEWMDGRPSTRQVDSARSACYQDAYLLPYEQPVDTTYEHLLPMSSLRAATTRCSSRSSVAPPLPSRSGLKARRRCGCMQGFHQAGTRCLGGIGRRSIGDFGRASRPHRSLRLGRKRLNCTSRVRGAARSLARPPPGGWGSEPWHYDNGAVDMLRRGHALRRSSSGGKVSGVTRTVGGVPATPHVS